MDNVSTHCSYNINSISKNKNLTEVNKIYTTWIMLVIYKLIVHNVNNINKSLVLSSITYVISNINMTYYIKYNITILLIIMNRLILEILQYGLQTSEMSEFMKIRKQIQICQIVFRYELAKEITLHLKRFDMMAHFLIF